MKTKLASIMAIDLGGGIGYQDALPWGRNRDDMLWFKAATDHQRVVVSPKTFDSIPNGLPNRTVVRAYRQPTNTSREDYLRGMLGASMDYPYASSMPIIIGGKKIYEAFEEETVIKFITVVPGYYEADTKVNLKELFDLEKWSVRFIGGSILNQNYCYLVILDRRGEELTHGGIHGVVNKHFEPYVKLTLKKGIIIKPDCHGVADINELIAIPQHQTGIFSIRKSLAIKGLYTSGQVFRRNWLGYPQIVITNKSLEDIELKAGSEVGELALLNSNYTG